MLANTREKKVAFINTKILDVTSQQSKDKITKINITVCLN